MIVISSGPMSSRVSQQHNCCHQCILFCNDSRALVKACIASSVTNCVVRSACDAAQRIPPACGAAQRIWKNAKIIRAHSKTLFAHTHSRAIGSKRNNRLFCQKSLGSLHYLIARFVTTPGPRTNHHRSDDHYRDMLTDPIHT